MNSDILQKAVKQGIINSQQYEQIMNLSAQDDTPTVYKGDREKLKFLRNFGDIFISIGIILFVLTARHLSDQNTLLQFGSIISLLLISEWLAGIKKQLLPSMTLLLALLFSMHELASRLFPLESSLSALLIAAVSLLFYLRYKLPFSLYPVAASLIALFFQFSGLSVMDHPHIIFALGVLVFIAAMWFDSRDPLRQYRYSDNAFWLHLLAAPLLVHGAMIQHILNPHSSHEYTTLYIALMLAVFFMLALFIDRRALLVSSFIYAIYLVFQFTQQQFIQLDNILSYSLMAVAVFIMFFGTYWYRIRSLIFASLKGTKVSFYLPPFEYKTHE